MSLMYGAHPRLLKTGQNINDPDEIARQAAVANLQEGIDEAYELGAEGFAFLSGGYSVQNRQLCYDQLLKSAVELCRYASDKGNMMISLSVFDHDVDKRCLIGPTELAVKLAADVRKSVNNFGLLVDLTHIPLLHETIEQALIPAAPYLNHVHIGNSVVTPGLAAYGDQHPRFGFPGSVNGIAEIMHFLRVLFKIGYLDYDHRATLSFEIKPFENEDPEIIIANAKRYLNEAWAGLQL
jgi:sugar phosphate isomerase/epimerase